MGGTTSPNLIQSVLQSALQRAHPNPLPAGQVITEIGDAEAAVDVGASAQATLTPLSQLVWAGPGVQSGSSWGGGQWQ
jgi:hypothetical protein